MLVPKPEFFAWVWTILDHLRFACATVWFLPWPWFQKEPSVGDECQRSEAEICVVLLHSGMLQGGQKVIWCFTCCHHCTHSVFYDVDLGFCSTVSLSLVSCRSCVPNASSSCPFLQLSRHKLFGSVCVQSHQWQIQS